jgi:hypothetical protein
MRKLKCEICLIESEISHFHRDNPVLKCGHTYTTSVVEQINKETSDLIDLKMKTGLNFNDAMDAVITELM